MIGTPYGIARYYDDKIEWDNSPTNELLGHEMDKDTPCTNQNKRNKFIWQNQLEWEKRKNKE